MSLSAAALRKMLDMGLSLEQAVELAEVWEAGSTQPIPELSKGAIRTRKWREGQEAKRHRDVTETHNGDVSHVGEPAQVVNPSLPSLRSEEVKNPIPSNEGIPPLKPKIAKPNGFARFWEAYPNKAAKLVAEKAYAKALRTIPGPDPPGVILAGVERAKASRQWREGFIPHPATWLNRGSWDDEPAEITPTRKAHDRPDPDPRPTAREDNLRNLHAGAVAALNRRERALG